MADITISVKVKNYKCFGDTPQGFDVIKPINVIVGRNNSGKSALLDVIQQACGADPHFNLVDSPPGKTASIVYVETITEPAARAVFRDNTTGGHIHGNHWDSAGKQYLGARISWEQPNNTNREGRRLLSISHDVSGPYLSANAREAHELNLARAMPSPLEGRAFRRLAAERNVGPESDSQQLDPLPSGLNVTNMVQNFANVAALDRNVVDVLLLDGINSITEPDYSFTAITPRKLSNGSWEIFLREAEKGLIALSASGSGLKTILCVLAQMAIWPLHNGKQLNQCIFGFEELENSLHPALLRRLLQYISYRIKAENGCIFLTTHSATAIDMFAGDSDAQIIHTSHRAGDPATATTVSEYLHRRTVLDDLDLRASDLLQSNGIIWVEGPSDRTLVNRWIALDTDGALREGTHYQCIFYGGKLLAHLSADDPTEVDRFVSILRVNRNAGVMIDSDRCQASDPINSTKQRILAEVGSMDGFTWVTAGREIENYLPVQAIAAVEGLNHAPPLDAFQDIAGYLEAQKSGAGKRFEKSKAEFAARVAEVIGLEAQSMVLDWRSKMDALCAEVRKWNRIAPPPP